jgi:UrcA family protein
MMKKTTLILVAAAALAAPAAAADPLNYRADARHVQYSDLNLESDAGRAALERRLARAVRSICAVPPELDSRAIADAEARCEAETAASIDGMVDAATRANRARATRSAGL